MPKAPSPLHTAARLSRPRLSPTLVPRQRLSDLVDVGVRRSVTLVCAGAGWGKTLLVASWAETSSARVAWLTLNADDNDPSLFWRHVVAALKAAGAVRDRDPLAKLGSPLKMNEEFLLRVVRGLTHLATPVVLVLDDFQEIDEPSVLEDLAALLRYPPDNLRMVLVTRTEPGLPLHRLRAAGELTEIRTADLAFRSDEAEELLARHGLRLTEAELTGLLARTEGWPAGLQLALTHVAQGGNGGRISQFPDDIRAVADYLTQEVFAVQPPDVRRFLLYTSILDEICAELADAITGGTHSQFILEQLERANLFVEGLGSQPRWFRYHHLLRDVLRYLLTLESPAMVPKLHLLAARWYVSQNATLDALRHALAAQDWPFVGRLVATWSAPMIVSADRTALVRVLRRIPTDQLSATPELILCAGLLLFDAGDYGDIPERIAQARGLLHGRSDADRLPVEISLRTLEAAAFHRVRGDMPGLVAATTDVLARLPKVGFDGLPSLLQYRAIALNNKGVGLMWNGQTDQADRYLWAGMTAARAAGLQPVEINGIGHLALVALLRGSVREASEHAINARKLAEQRGLSAALQTVAAHFALALVEIERNNIAEAEQAFRQGFHAHRADPEAAQAVVASLTRARLLTARGEVEAARAVLEQAPRKVDPVMVAPGLDRWYRLTESELDLLSGRADSVTSRYGQLPELSPAETVCLARAHLLLGDLDRADAQAARARAVSAGSLFAVWSWMVSALVADAQGHGNRSVDALARAVAIARPEGIRRPFLVVAGRSLIPLVERQRWLVKENAGFIADLLTEMDTSRGVQPETVTDLSERELEVLRYLPTVLTAAEVAEELHVSVNTVKAHQRAIYRKLDVSRRREAVIQARERGLV